MERSHLKAKSLITFLGEIVHQSNKPIVRAKVEEFMHTCHADAYTLAIEGHPLTKTEQELSA